MIIKFRDATIKRSKEKSDTAPEVEQLHEEIKLLKEQLESNPITAKIYSENEQLLNERDSLKKEVEETIDSITHQYKSSIEFTDELRNYVKEYLEKADIEQDLLIQQQLEL
jgi:uncharacterized protein YktB (UPF0637 family)